MRAPPSPQERLCGAIAALLPQFGLALLLLASFAKKPPPAAAELREVLLMLPRLAPAAPPQASAEKTQDQSRPDAAPAPAVPWSVWPYYTTPYFSLREAPDAARDQALLAALGRDLANCRIDLPPDLAARASALCPRQNIIVQQAPSLLGAPSHARDEARWAAEWQRKQSPPLLPCGGFSQPLCLIGKILDGSLSDFGDPATWPTYIVKELPREDFYKIQQAYDAWNKEHGKAPRGALTSARPGEDGNEKDRIVGGGAGADPGPGPGGP